MKNETGCETLEKIDADKDYRTYCYSSWAACVCVPSKYFNSVSRATNTQTTQVRFQWLQNAVIE